MKIKSKKLLIDLILNRKYKLCVVDYLNNIRTTFSQFEYFLLYDDMIMCVGNLTKYTIYLSYLKKFSVLKDETIFLYIDKNFTFIQGRK